MKRIFAILIALLPFICSAQQAGASNWGQRILFGTTFTTTDSTRLVSSSLRDTVLADTLYSGVLGISDYTEGIYDVSAFLTNVGGTSDSISLDVRMVTVFTDENARATHIKFGAWNSVFNVIDAATTTIDTTISQSTSSWWRAKNGRQYRLYDESVTTDTTNHLITDYVR